MHRVIVVLLALVLAGATYRYSWEIKSWWGFHILALKTELRSYWH